MEQNSENAGLAGRGVPVVSKAVAAGNYNTTFPNSNEIDVREYAARVVSQRLGINMPVARLVSFLAGLAVAA